ncbi:leucyl-tRNA synthetase [Streptococcus pneumoniae]|nr:leucyl-tRNA synthetase [Streptococcus pneumoniae]
MITSKEILAENNGALDKAYNETVKAVTEQIESLKFNTAIAQLMVFVNAANKEDKLYIDYAKGFIQLIAPFAPHLAEAEIDGKEIVKVIAVPNKLVNIVVK